MASQPLAVHLETDGIRWGAHNAPLADTIPARHVPLTLNFSKICFARYRASTMVDIETAIPEGSWVLVTAANGYTGSHIVIELLKRGFKVRGTVRDSSCGQWLLNDDIISPFARRGDLELVVAHCSVPNAFDDVVKGVSAVIYNAIISDIVPDPNITISATVRAALNVCRSAAREPSIKRFVITSTFWTVAMPIPGVTDTITNLDTWNEAALEAAWAPPPYEPDRVLHVYFAAKIESEKAIWTFANDERLPWVVNSVSPCCIMGDLRDDKQLHAVPPQLLESLYLGNTDALRGTPASMLLPGPDELPVVRSAANTNEKDRTPLTANF